MSNTAGRKWEMIYIYIYSTISIPRTRKPRESMELHENSNQKFVTKYPAPRAQKRDVAETTYKKK